MASPKDSGLHAGTEAHGGSGHSSFPPFNTDTFAPQLVWLTLTFLALYYLMSRIVLPRIGEVLEDRRERIQRDLDTAERLKAETEKALAAYEQALADARANAGAIAKETRDRLAERVAARQSQVESEIDAKLTAAEQRIGATRTQAMASVNEIAADVAGDLVEKLIGSKASAEEIRQALIAQGRK